MNIYKVTIDQNGYGLDAVVTADNEKDAVRMLDLNSDREFAEDVSMVGVCLGDVKAEVIARESL